MASLFISYRREDASGHAGRLCDRLSSRFGGDRVFMDVQDITPGQDFSEAIDATISGCNCLIAVIGPRWLDLLKSRPVTEDYVRREIGSALKRGLTVIPVLVNGASMPSQRDLPSDLSLLSHRNAFQIRDERFEDDVARLEEHLRASVSDTGTRPGSGWLRSRAFRLGLPALVLVIIASVFVATRPSPPHVEGDWIAEMQKPGQRPYRIRLHFVVLGEQISGSVQYPTGDAPVLGAELKGSSLQFRTEHVPQFESTPATIRFQAEVKGEEIRLAATDESGVATGVAKRQATK